MRICKDCFSIVSYTCVSSVLIQFPWHSLASDTGYSCPRFTLIVCGERKYAEHWWNVCYGKWNWFYVIKTPLIKRNDHWKFQICRTKSILSLKYHIFFVAFCVLLHTEQNSTECGENRSLGLLLGSPLFCEKRKDACWTEEIHNDLPLKET